MGRDLSRAMVAPISWATSHSLEVDQLGDGITNTDEKGSERNQFGTRYVSGAAAR